MSAAKGTESSPEPIDASASAVPTEDSSELSLFGLGIGSTLAGKYLVESVIGSGGMSVVVRALHTLLGQPVALKLLRPELAQDPIHVERFLREALAAAQLKNEHVVRILDADRLPDGVPYLVMEALEGSDLAKVLLARGPLPVADVVYYVLQACEAVAEAHGRGIVHRDLKPSNLFLTATSEGTPSVKVLDFGISKLEASLHDLQLTGTMMVLGSPLHMSPEQIRDSRTVDRRTDIWSLGTLAFELLAGRPPFLAETASALIARISADRPEALSAFRSDVPSELETVLMRCLEKDRALRIQSVDELVRLLSPFAPPEAWPHIDRALRLAQSAPWPPRGGDTQRISDAIALSNPQPSEAKAAAEPQNLDELEPAVGLRTRRVERADVPGLGPSSAAASPPKSPAVSVVGWGTTQRPLPSERKRSRVPLWVAAGVLSAGTVAGLLVWQSQRSAAGPHDRELMANAVAGGVSNVETTAPAERAQPALAPSSRVEAAAPSAAPSPAVSPPPGTALSPAAAPSPAALPSAARKNPSSPARAAKKTMERPARPRSAPNPSIFEERQ